MPVARPSRPLEPAVEPELYDPAVHGYSRDLKSDHPGRAFDPGSGQRHAIEPRHDPHAYEKHQFARRIAGIWSPPSPYFDSSARVTV